MHYSLQDLESVVDALYPLFQKHAVMTFSGSLGAGKTTLVQALLKRAGVKGPIQSPTFAYVHDYTLPEGLLVHHFDLYRLGSLEDFAMAGFEEYLYKKNAKVLVEWPEIIFPLLKHNVCHVAIDYEGLDKRRLAVSCKE